jgi:hypothetical protein
MKTLNKVFATIAFYTLVIVVFMWTATLTLAEMREIMPNDPVTPFFALALFDGGAVVWLLVFTGKAKGLWQRGISAIMLGADLIGVIAISMARLLTAGQSMTTISPELGAAVVYGVGIMTAINFLGIYGFHVTDPYTLAEIEAQSLEDELYQEAQEQARANMEGEKAQLAGVLAARATAGIKARLYLPISDRETLAMTGVIDGEIVEDITANQPTQKSKSAAGVPAWMVAAASLLKRKKAPVKPPTEKPENYQRDTGELSESGGLYNAFRQGIAEAQGVEVDDLKSPLDMAASDYGDPKDTDNPVYFWNDGSPRYHPEFKYKGHTYKSDDDGNRIAVLFPAEEPADGANFQELHESQDGGLDGGYIPTQEAV